MAHDGTSAPALAARTRKFADPDWTAKGEPRAQVALTALHTLWFNTGTLCNVTCANCYIESSPRNDRLAYITRSEVASYLDEIARDALPVAEIGLTGGEPFMNPDIVAILEQCLARGFRVLVLTNAMKPMTLRKAALLELRARHDDRLIVRVSLDHYTRELHEAERGRRTWQPTLDNLVWLSANGFCLNVAGRTRWGEDEAALRAGYARLFAAHGIAVDAADPVALVLFPEMDEAAEVPEITTACWGILGVKPEAQMCATSRMVVKRKGQDKAVVVPCTLLPYDPAFELGHSLTQAAKAVRLNHPHCAKFCVLGGASCSPA